jgi:hypothetical protein
MAPPRQGRFHRALNKDPIRVEAVSIWTSGLTGRATRRLLFVQSVSAECSEKSESGEHWSVAAFNFCLLIPDF